MFLHFLKAIRPFAISSDSRSRSQLSISSGSEDVSKLFHSGDAFGKQVLPSDITNEASVIYIQSKKL